MVVIWKTLFSFSHEYFHKLNLKIGCTGVQYEMVEEWSRAISKSDWKQYFFEILLEVVANGHT